MAIRVTCPACGAGLRVSDEAAGKRGKCPKCGDPIIVPAAEPDPADDLVPIPLAEEPSAPTPMANEAESDTYELAGAQSKSVHRAVRQGAATRHKTLAGATQAVAPTRAT